VQVFHSKSFQVNHRITVRHIVPIGVRVKQQVGRIEHPYSIAAGECRRANVQAGDEIANLCEMPVSIIVLKNSDLVRSRDLMGRWRWREVIIFDAPIFIVPHHLQARGKGILQILNDPHAAAFVESQIHRLGELRLGNRQLHAQPIGHTKLAQRFGRGVSPGLKSAAAKQAGSGRAAPGAAPSGILTHREVHASPNRLRY
jgi:hypothetical protein